MIDPEKRKKMIERIPDLKHCIQCGTCTASCPSSWYMDDFSPRAIMLQALSGSDEMLSENLWKCITCNRCNELCPQGVNPFDVIVELKNIAYEEGFISEDRKKALDAILQNIIDTGSTFFINDAVQRQRQEMGLDKLEFDNEELKKLFDEDTT